MIQQGVQVYTFFIHEGHKLNVPKHDKLWAPIEKKENGFKLYKQKCIIDFILPGGEVLRVPQGFEFDGASIPKMAQWLIGPPMGKYALAANIHDWLYMSRLLGDTKKGRKQADKLFKTVLIQLGISRWRTKMMFLAVRIGGSNPYHQSDESKQCFRLFSALDPYNPWLKYSQYFPNRKVL